MGGEHTAAPMSPGTSFSLSLNHFFSLSLSPTAIVCGWVGWTRGRIFGDGACVRR